MGSWVCPFTHYRSWRLHQQSASTPADSPTNIYKLPRESRGYLQQSGGRAEDPKNLRPQSTSSTKLHARATHVPGLKCCHSMTVKCLLNGELHCTRQKGGQPAAKSRVSTADPLRRHGLHHAEHAAAAHNAGEFEPCARQERPPLRRRPLAALNKHLQTHPYSLTKHGHVAFGYTSTS